MPIQLNIGEILRANPIVPVMTVTQAEEADRLVESLLAQDLGIVEVALRTDAALAAITRIRRQHPTLTVGAGTITTPEDFARVTDAGAQFGVSPGTTTALLDAAGMWDLPFLPGSSTVSESMNLASIGYSIQKFFPASAMGGINALRAIAGPLPNVRFCPSGGITESDFRDYLALPNVIAVSGSWMLNRMSK